MSQMMQTESESSRLERVPFLSIVVPCFNEEEGMSALHERLMASAKAGFGENFEIVFVDDGSSDHTWTSMVDLNEQYPHIVAVKLSRNHGHQLALSAGLTVASGDLVLVIDGDLQDPPELLAPMFELLRSEEADVVYGQRRTRAGESWFKRGTASLFYRILSRFTDVNIPVDTGDFRLMTRRAAKLIVQMPERDRFIRGMVAWIGFKQVPFVYDREPRFAGSTKYPFAKMLRFAMDAFLGHSMALLRISAYFAGLTLIVLGGVGAHALYSWFFLDAVPGWTSLTMLIVALGAFQLIVLSILGEYIGRIYLEGKRRPVFIIDQIKRSFK